MVKTLTSKEPWQMTKREYLSNLPANVRGAAGYSGEHEVMVKNALAIGKPVPPEVLKDYPDLAKQVKVTPAEPKRQAKINKEVGEWRGALDFQMRCRCWWIFSWQRKVYYQNSHPISQINSSVTNAGVTI